MRIFESLAKFWEIDQFLGTLERVLESLAYCCNLITSGKVTTYTQSGSLSFNLVEDRAHDLPHKTWIMHSIYAYSSNLHGSCNIELNNIERHGTCSTELHNTYSTELHDAFSTELHDICSTALHVSCSTELNNICSTELCDTMPNCMMLTVMNCNDIVLNYAMLTVLNYVMLKHGSV